MKERDLVLLKKFAEDAYQLGYTRFQDVEDNLDVVFEEMMYTPAKKWKLKYLFEELDGLEKERFFLGVIVPNDVVDPEIMMILESYNLTKAEFLFKNISYYQSSFGFKPKNLSRLYHYRSKLLQEKFPGNETDIQEKIIQYVENHFKKYHIDTKYLPYREYIEELGLQSCAFSHELIQALDFKILYHLSRKPFDIYLYLKKIIGYYGTISKISLIQEANTVFTFETEFIEELLAILSKEEVISIDENTIVLKRTKVQEYIKQNLDKLAILDYRFQGLTLQEVGDIFQLTRERIRQIEAKLLSKLIIDLIDETQYLDFYQQYDIEKDDFKEIFQLDDYQYHYLESVGKKSSNLKTLEQLIYQVRYDGKIVEKLIQVLNKDYVLDEGQKILKTRIAILHYCIKKYGQDNLAYEDLNKIYNQFCIDKGVEDFCSYDRAFDGLLSRSTVSLYKYGRKLRYYPHEDYDIESFIQQIDFTVYENSEISAYKIFSDYSFLMNEFDIKDEYELHNLLKHYSHLIKQEHTLLRMPLIGFGKFSRDEQVISILKEISPVSKEDLTEAYHEQYGVLRETIKANYLKVIEKYWYKDCYRMDVEKPKREVIDNLRTFLKEDFYFKEDIIKHLKLFNINHIQKYLYKELGYLNFEKYIIKDSYHNSEDYFKQHYFNKDEFFIHDVRIVQTPVFNKLYEQYNSNLDYFECQKYHYISLKKLMESTNVSKDNLKKILNKIKVDVQDKYFSTKTVAKYFEEITISNGMSNLLQSIIRSDKDYRFQSCGRMLVFKKVKDKFYTSDLLLHHLEDIKKITVDSFKKFLFQTYGCDFERHKILENLQETNVYHHPESDTLYLNRDEFFQDLISCSNHFTLSHQTQTK